MQILIPNRITPSRYAKVVSLMRKMGSPVIHCLEIRPGYYFALEGSHRTTAALELGLEPILMIIDNLEGDEPLQVTSRKEVRVREMRGLCLEFPD
jgi:ParB-like chromosome segregation protein Spo0J